MRIAAQLYTIRQLGDLATQLQFTARCGFQDIETVGFHDLSVAAMVETVKASKLSVRSMHFDWFEFETRMDDIIRILPALNCATAIMPWLPREDRPTNAAGWKAIAQQLGDWAAFLAKHDIRLGYHNHDYELWGEAGATALDIVLAGGNIFWQPDTGWIGAEEADFEGLFTHFSDRIISIHAKDVDPQGGVEDERWRDIGDGVLDWSKLLNLLAQTNCGDLFVEHDESPNHQKTFVQGRTQLAALMSEAANA